MSNYGFNTTVYDDADRLTTWNRTDGNQNQSWNLTPVGDWNSFTENTVTQNRTHGNAHELTTVGSNSLAYDAKGNLTANSNYHTYLWDLDNHMATATIPTGSANGIEGTHAYTYDALGRRVSKTVNNTPASTTTTTLFIQKTEPIAYSPYAGQVISEYTSTDNFVAPKEQYTYASYIDEPILKDATLRREVKIGLK